MADDRASRARKFSTSRSAAELRPSPGFTSDAEVQLGQMSALLQATPIPIATSTPIPTDTPPPTPTKTRKPPTSMPVADCDRTGYPRRGWLYDYDLKGEVALWAKPNLPFKNGNTVVSTVPIPVVGGSVVVTVLALP